MSVKEDRNQMGMGRSNRSRGGERL